MSECFFGHDLRVADIWRLMHEAEHKKTDKSFVEIQETINEPSYRSVLHPTSISHRDYQACGVARHRNM